MIRVACYVLRVTCYVRFTTCEVWRPKIRPSTPAAISLAGTFSGRWLGQNEVGGDLRFKFSPGTDAPWTADVLFVYEGTDVHAKTQSVQINGNKVEVVITWEIQGTAASTTLTGILSGQDIEGTYKSTAAEEPATGKWKVSRG